MGVMNVRYFFFLYVILALFPCRSLLAAETRFGCELSDHLIVENNLYDEDQATGYTSDSTGNEIVFSPYAEFSYGDTLSAFFLSNFSGIHYFDDHDDDVDGELANAFACLKNKSSLICAGLQPFNFGRGLIYDENEPGLSVDLGTHDRLKVNIMAAALDQSSSLWSINFVYIPSLFEKFEVFSAYYNAGDQAFSRNFYAFEERSYMGTPYLVGLPLNSGDLMYAGGGFDVFMFGAYVRMTAIAQKGHITFSTDKARINRKMEVTSFIADLDVSRNIGELWSFSILTRIMSGGPSDLESNKLHSYISPLPLTLRSLVFDNDQFAPEDYRDGIVSRSMTLSGLVAPGLSLTCTPTDNLLLKSMASLFYPYDQPGENQTFYGWEWDISLFWTVNSWLNYSFEAGYFQHGDVFKNEQGEKPPPASRVITGITVSF